MPQIYIIRFGETVCFHFFKLTDRCEKGHGGRELPGGSRLWAGSELFQLRFTRFTPTDSGSSWTALSPGYATLTPNGIPPYDQTVSLHVGKGGTLTKNVISCDQRAKGAGCRVLGAQALRPEVSVAPGSFELWVSAVPEEMQPDRGPAQTRTVILEFLSPPPHLEPK